MNIRIYRSISCFLWESISSLTSEMCCTVNLKIWYEQCKSPANSFLNGGRVIASVSTLERLLFLMQESRNVSFAFFWMILIIWMNDTILIPKWLQRDCINVGLFLFDLLDCIMYDHNYRRYCFSVKYFWKWLARTSIKRLG